VICMKICCSRGAGAPSPAVGFAAGVGERDGGARTAVLRGAGEVEGDLPRLDLAAPPGGSGAVSRAQRGKRRAHAGRAGEEGAQMETERWSGENEGRRW